MQVSSTAVKTNCWVKADWEEFTTLANHFDDEQGKFYYHKGWMKIEMSPIGVAHARDNSIISTVIVLYAALNNLPIQQLVNCSYKKIGFSESQPDLSYYLGDNLPDLPRNNSPIDLDQSPAPSLVIEIGSSSFLDDLGKKRLLYEQLGITEYWVVDVAESQVIAFRIHNQGSYQISESEVLPKLFIDQVEEALRKSQTEDDGAITRWLMTVFSNQGNELKP